MSHEMRVAGRAREEEKRKEDEGRKEEYKKPRSSHRKRVRKTDTAGKGKSVGVGTRGSGPRKLRKATVWLFSNCTTFCRKGVAHLEPVSPLLELLLEMDYRLLNLVAGVRGQGA